MNDWVGTQSPAWHVGTVRYLFFERLDENTIDLVINETVDTAIHA